MTQKNFRIFLLTGAPGCGKTTLIKKICSILKEKKIQINGFYTEEIKINHKRIGFDVVTLNGNRAPLARIDSNNDSKKYLVGKYSVKVSSFESCVLNVLETWDKNCILVIDEIGKMELCSKAFEDVIQKCLISSDGLILATVPLTSFKPIPIVEMIKNHPLTLLMTVDRETRNQLEDKIITYIMKAKKNE